MYIIEESNVDIQARVFRTSNYPPTVLFSFPHTLALRQRHAIGLLVNFNDLFVQSAILIRLISGFS